MSVRSVLINGAYSYNTSNGVPFNVNSLHLTGGGITFPDGSHQGEAGGRGATGERGQQGIQGVQGATGAMGYTGAQGDTGATGAMGATGATGSNGNNGAIGATGAMGATGLDGATGQAGTNGLDGATGAQGATGSAGVIEPYPSADGTMLMTTGSNVITDSPLTWEVSANSLNLGINRINFTGDNVCNLSQVGVDFPTNPITQKSSYLHPDEIRFVQFGQSIVYLGSGGLVMQYPSNKNLTLSSLEGLIINDTNTHKGSYITHTSIQIGAYPNPTGAGSLLTENYLRTSQIMDTVGSLGLAGQQLICNSSSTHAIVWTTPVVEVEVNNNIVLPVSSIIYADSSITPILTYSVTKGYDGWGFVNALSSQKYNWYFAPPNATTTVSQISGVYFTFYAMVATTASFITVYTKPATSPNWYNSKRNFIFASGALVVGQQYIAYYQADPSVAPPTKYGHLPLPMTISPVAPVGAYAPTEQIMFWSVGSNSAMLPNTEQLIVSSVGVIINDGISPIYNQPFTFNSA